MELIILVVLIVGVFVPPPPPVTCHDSKLHPGTGTMICTSDEDFPDF